MAQVINAELRNGQASILRSLPKLANIWSKGFDVLVDFRGANRAPDKKIYVNVFLAAADLKEFCG
jgi:hypothetical protein